MYAASKTQPPLRYGSLGIPMGKIGMWVFLASEVMFFAGLIDSYIVLRFSTPDWPVPTSPERFGGVGLVALMTFVLICSSGTMVLSLAAFEAGDRKKALGFLGATIGGGLFFLGCQAYEWTEFIVHKGARPSSDLFWGTFFTLTGFHGFHVTCGVLALTWIFFRALRGRYTPQNSLEVELAGLYWHFVDLVWIIIFTIVYLV